MLKNLKIGARIGITIAIPLLALTISAAYILYSKHEEMTAATELKTAVNSITQLVELIYNLQKERGISAVFVGSHGAQMADTLPTLRLATDEAQKATENAFIPFDKTSLAPSVAETEKQAWGALSQLTDKRRTIENFNITAAESSAYFTQTIARLISLETAISNQSNNPDVQRKLFTLIAFDQAKERAGQERALGAARLAQDILLMQLHI